MAIFKHFQITVITIVLGALISVSIQVPVFAQSDVLSSLPVPGSMVHLSKAFAPAALKGIIIHPHNPLQFDFIIHRGDRPLSASQKREEYTRLLKYFLAALAIPDDHQWVNLSPYEKDRIIHDDFGKTQMGYDLLAQDYVLKQITASLIYPQDKLGKAFWDKVYAKAQKQYGTTNIPINTFNKVWIVPDDALIYEKGSAAYVVENHLRVMLEEDYLALQNNTDSKTRSIASEILRDIVLPALEQEVNQGENFAPLRQVYSGMLLAAWFKQKLKMSFLGRVYANKGKIKGIDHDLKNNERIYQYYLQAYKKGVFNFIKDDADKLTGQPVPRSSSRTLAVARKYFSGGMRGYNAAMVHTTTDKEIGDKAMAIGMPLDDIAQVNLVKDAAMDATVYQLITDDILNSARATQETIAAIMDQEGDTLTVDPQAVGKLNGKLLAVVDADGRFKIDVNGYAFNWRVYPHFMKQRVKVYINEARINEHNRLEFRLTFAQEGFIPDDLKAYDNQVFEIGAVKTKIYLRRKKKKEDRPEMRVVWDIVPAPRIGLAIFAAIINDVDGFNAQDVSRKINSIAGYDLGRANKSRQLAINLGDDFTYPWAPGDIDLDGTTMAIERAWVNNDGYCEFEMKFVKRNGQVIEKKFEIGRFLRRLSSTKREGIEQQYRNVLRIVPRSEVAREVVALVMSKSNLLRVGGDSIKELHYLSDVMEAGIMSVTPEGYERYMWNLLGFYGDGWKAFLVSLKRNADGLYRCVVAFKKEGEPIFTRTFEMGRQGEAFEKVLMPANPQSDLPPLTVSRILAVEEVGNKLLGRLLFDKKAFKAGEFFNHIQNLEGYPLTDTNGAGLGNFTVDGYDYTPYFGKVENGWQIFMGKARLNKGQVEFDLIYRKRNRTPFAVKFYVDGQKTIARNDKGEKREVYKLVKSGPTPGRLRRDREGLVGLIFDQGHFLSSTQKPFLKDLDYLTGIKIPVTANHYGMLELKGAKDRKVAIIGLEENQSYQLTQDWIQGKGLVIYLISKARSKAYKIASFLGGDKGIKDRRSYKASRADAAMTTGVDYEMREMIRSLGPQLKGNLDAELTRDPESKTLQRVINEDEIQAQWLMQLIAGRKDKNLFFNLLMLGVQSPFRWVRLEAIKAAGGVDDPSFNRVLLTGLKDPNVQAVMTALDVLYAKGTEEDIPELVNIEEEAPEQMLYHIYDEHSDIVIYTAPIKESNYTTHNLKYKGEEVRANPVKGRVREVILKIKQRSFEHRRARKLPVAEIKSKHIKDFLAWLKSAHLDDIVLIGGSIRDELVGKEPTDLDISVAVPLTEEEYFQMLPTTAQANDRAFNYARERLQALAAAISKDNLQEQYTVDDFFDGRKKILWRGLEVQYSGPIKIKDQHSGQDVYIKRALIDRNTLGFYSSSAGPALLKLALDPNGQLYGDVEAIEDLKQGRFFITGDPVNLNFVGVLRCIRLKHELGLVASARDLSILREKVRSYKDNHEGYLKNPAIQDVIRRQLLKLVQTAQDQRRLYHELEILGVLDVLQREVLGIDLSEFFPELAAAPGGIDMNPSNAKIRIAQDRDHALVASDQDLTQLNNMDGLIPVIISIKPAMQVAIGGDS